MAFGRTACRSERDGSGEKSAHRLSGREGLSDGLLSSLVLLRKLHGTFSLSSSAGAEEER
jgi:hypothetical protein